MVLYSHVPILYRSSSTCVCIPRVCDILASVVPNANQTTTNQTSLANGFCPSEEFIKKLGDVMDHLLTMFSSSDNSQVGMPSCLLAFRFLWFSLLTFRFLWFSLLALSFLCLP